MKKLFTILSVVAVSATATYAQRAVVGEMAGVAKPNMMMLDKADTSIVQTPGIGNPSAGCDTLTIYTTNGGGAVTGFNEYGDMEKAAVFSGSGTVIAVFAQVGFAGNAPGENGDFAAKIYSKSGATFTQLAISPAIPATAIDDSTGTPTVWPVSATVSGSFAAGVEVAQYDMTDTTLEAGLFIYGTKQNCGDGAFGWEKTLSGTWQSFDAPGPNGWAIELEVAIGVAITGFSSNPESELISGTSLYPNPVEDQFSLAYTSKVDGNVRVDIIDAAGRTVKMVNDGYKPAGTYMTNVNTDGMASGLYTYRLTVGGKQAQGKFMVK